MNEGEMVSRTDILGYKGILLKKLKEEPPDWARDKQLRLDYGSDNWKVFWFQHPFSKHPIVDVMPEKLLKKIPSEEKRFTKYQV